MRYVLHPGYVVSRMDGDRHYIGVAQLRALYGLRPSDDFLVIDGPRWMHAYRDDDIHLYPRYDGNYRLVHE